MGDVGDELKNFKIIKEGEAEILMPANTNSVFFNKAQVYNRDMSIAILRTFIAKRKEDHNALLNKKAKSKVKVLEGTSGSAAEDANQSKEKKSNEDSQLQQDKNLHETESHLEECLKIPSKWSREIKEPKVLEALAASGLRSLRYAREVDGIGKVIALDNDKGSIASCKRNIRFNGSATCSKVEAHFADARVYMLTHEKEFDVVDVDPYGSPAVFLDSAVQSIADGGILMCTATDMAVLCGNNGEACYSKYGSYPLKGKYCHEMALRILLASIESHANRYKRHIVPVLSVYMDFYIRVFVRIYTSANAVKETPLKLSYVYQCVGCDSFHLQALGRAISKDKNIKYAPGFAPVVSKECSDCGKRFNMGGPIWTAPIHDNEWVLSTLASVRAMKERYPAYEKISAVLTSVSEELHDIPLFISPHSVCSTLKCTAPPAIIFRSALINAGYRVSGCHVNPLGIKTDAPMNVIWDIMRCWIKNHPIKAQRPDMPGSVILSKEPSLEVNFARPVGSVGKPQVKKEKRWLPNPERSWGPKIKAGRKITSKHSSLLGPQVVQGNDEYKTEPEAVVDEIGRDVSHEVDEPANKQQKTS